MNVMAKIPSVSSQPLEIERRFLVNRKVAEEMAYGHNMIEIEQVYLGRTGEWSIRSRKIGKIEPKFRLTMKRPIANGTNVEIEQAGDPKTHMHFFLQAGVALEKRRYRIPLSSGHILELDLFDNHVLDALAIAEVELGSIDEDVALPDWIGDEVTGQKGFSNASLFDRLLMTASIKIERFCS